MDSLPEPNPVPRLTLRDLLQTAITVSVRVPWTIAATLCRRWWPWSNYTPPPLQEHLFRHVMTCLGNNTPLSLWQRWSDDHSGTNLLTSTRYAHLHPQLFHPVRRTHFSGYWICRGVGVAPIDPAAADLVILHCHGGGYVAGHPSACAPELVLAAEILHHHGLIAAIFSLDYTLAPKATFPTQRDEALAAYDWLLRDRRINPQRILLIGDSAGGHLVVSLLLAIHHRSTTLLQPTPKPKAALLISPWLNFHTDHPSLMALHWEDRLFKRSLDSYQAMLFAGAPPELDTLYGNFAVPEVARGSWADILPARTWVSAGSEELAFRYDMEDFVRAACRDGAAVTLQVEPGKDHTWQCSEAYAQHGRLLGSPMGQDDLRVMEGFRGVVREILRLVVV